VGQRRYLVLVTVSICAEKVAQLRGLMQHLLHIDQKLNWGELTRIGNVSRSVEALEDYINLLAQYIKIHTKRLALKISSWDFFN